MFCFDPTDLELDSVLQHHKALPGYEIVLGQCSVGVCNGELDSDGAEGALGWVTHNVQGGNALPEPGQRRRLPQQEGLAAVEGYDTVAIVAGQDVHRCYRRHGRKGKQFSSEYVIFNV